MVEVAELKSVT